MTPPRRRAVPRQIRSGGGEDADVGGIMLMVREGEMASSAVALKDDGRSLSLELPDGLAFDEWVQIGRRLCASSQVINWHIGDWWAFGDHRYGDRAAAAAEGLFGRDFGTLRNLATVARSFETSRRHDVLTFSHHQEVASLPREVADDLLHRAEREGLSTRDLRRAVIETRLQQRASYRGDRDDIDVRPQEPEHEKHSGASLAEMVVELAEALGRERGLSERESSFLEHGLRILSRDDPRVLVRWTAAEEISLVEMLQAGKRPPQIAVELGRTENAIWRQIGRMGGIGRILQQHGTGSVGRMGLSNG